MPQMCPCGKPIESRTHIVGECEMYKEGRDVLDEELRAKDDCDMEELVQLQLISARKRSLSY